MFNGASHPTVEGDATQVNAHAYNHSGSSTVNLHEGSQYSKTVTIHAGVYHEARLGDDPSLRGGSIDMLMGAHANTTAYPVSTELYAHTAVGCMHNSAARVGAAMCHPNTRKAVQDDMFKWVSRAATHYKDVLWLTGPAGTGKSAIMRTIAQTMAENDQLAATFFFSAASGLAELSSKRGLVVTLAYQLCRLEGSDDHISPYILDAVRRDPAIFQMSLEEQMERLVLQPLRRAGGQTSCQPPSARKTILIDGVDECGEHGNNEPIASKREGQIEVLSVLSKAIQDPEFPFNVIIASRPETWIREFFTDLSRNPHIRVTEIFLDEKYNPDADIRLFLTSKFAELCRRYGIDPSTWPSEEIITRLVQDASGQFIYVATVLRFIEAPGAIPQSQLDIVLKIKPQDTSNPFAALDLLYTSIIQSSPSPETTVRWLKATQRFRGSPSLAPSAWTINRVLEPHAGQAHSLLGGLPSLVYIPENAVVDTDSHFYGRQLEVQPSILPGAVGWDTSYAFYHKTFLDYLAEKDRCGIAFPSVDDHNVARWIHERSAQTLRGGGPEVPIHPSLLPVFRRCFLDLFVYSVGPGKPPRVDVDILSDCDPTVWLDVLEQVQPSGEFKQELYNIVHNTCRSYFSCNPGCKRWRQAILELSNGEWEQPPHSAPWSSLFNIGHLLES